MKTDCGDVKMQEKYVSLDLCRAPTLKSRSRAIVCQRSRTQTKAYTHSRNENIRLDGPIYLFLLKLI